MGFWTKVERTLDPKKNGVSKFTKKTFSKKVWKPVGKGVLNVGESVGKEALNIGKLGLDATKSILKAVPDLANMMPMILMALIVYFLLSLKK